MNILPPDVDYEKFLGQQESQHVLPLRDFQEGVRARLSAGPNEYGEHLPWKKTQNCLAFRPGELTIWCGIAGSGKSTLLGQVVAFFPRSTKSLIASLEMPPATTVAKMARQCTGFANPSDSALQSFFDAADNLWLYDQTDTVPQDRLVGMMAYAAQELGVSHVCLDSLVKAGIAVDDYDAQKRFVDRLTQLAKRLQIHIHLVAHLRKGASVNHVPDGFALKGAGEIRDLCDQLLILHRNREKEDKIQAGEIVEKNEPDALLIVDKNRHGEWIGKFRLYFHPASQQYMSDPDLCPMNWK